MILGSALRGAATYSLYYRKQDISSRLSRKPGGIKMYNLIKRIQLSRMLWIWIREWQASANVSDKELAGLLKVSLRTLKSYDISAHSITLEKIDNFINTAGESPLKYILNKLNNNTEHEPNSRKTTTIPDSITTNIPATVNHISPEARAYLETLV